MGTHAPVSYVMQTVIFGRNYDEFRHSVTTWLSLSSRIIPAT